MRAPLADRELWCGIPYPLGLLEGRSSASQVPREPCNAPALLIDPAEARSQAVSEQDAADQIPDSGGSRIVHFEARSHGFHIPSLRFAPTGRPAATQDSVLAVANFAWCDWLPTGLRLTVSSRRATSFLAYLTFPRDWAYLSHRERERVESKLKRIRWLRLTSHLCPSASPGFKSR